MRRAFVVGIVVGIVVVALGLFGLGRDDRHEEPAPRPSSTTMIPPLVHGAATGSSLIPPTSFYRQTDGYCVSTGQAEAAQITAAPDPTCKP